MIVDIVRTHNDNLDEILDDGEDFEVTNPSVRDMLLCYKFQVIFSSTNSQKVFTQRKWIDNLDAIEEFPEVVRLLQEYRRDLDKSEGNPRSKGASLEKRKLLRDYCAARSIYSLVFKVHGEADQIEDESILYKICQSIKHNGRISCSSSREFKESHGSAKF
jgi:hypothetical protein